MDGTIRVSPQLLSSTASEFGSQAGMVNNLTSEMVTLITGLCATWEGDAATTYINKFKGLEDDIQKIVRMINEHSTDLEEMARIYMETENTNMETANTLLADVIV